jgi:hypothetical protein
LSTASIATIPPLEFSKCDFDALIVMSVDWAGDGQRPWLLEFGLFDLFEFEAEAGVFSWEELSGEVDVVERVYNYYDVNNDICAEDQEASYQREGWCW